MNLFDTRPNYLDIAKILGIFSVLVGHYAYFFDIPFSSDSLIWKITHFVTLYHMPLFFIISGMLHSNKFLYFKSFFKKQCQALLIPYLLLSLSIGVPYYLFDGCDGNQIIKYLVGILTGGDLFGKVDIFPVGPLWFVFSLFSIKMLFEGFAYNSFLNSYKNIIVLFLCCLGMLMMFINKNIFPFRLDSTLVGFVFFSVGYYGKNLIFNILNSKKTRYVFLSIGLLALVLLYNIAIDNTMHKGLSININYYGSYPILFLFSGVLGTLTILVLSSIFAKYLKSSMLLTLSNGMIITLATHKVIFITLSYFNLLDSVENMFIISFIVLIISYLIILVVKRYIPVLLGYRS